MVFKTEYTYTFVTLFVIIVTNNVDVKINIVCMIVIKKTSLYFLINSPIHIYWPIKSIDQ